MDAAAGEGAGAVLWLMEGPGAENLRAAPILNPRSPETVPTLARVEWEHMQRVISDCGGNISQAARLLGIHRRSLQRKLGKYPPVR